jgi:TRAP-type mannitol/chloroaromatic compound transport system permease large subunit
MSEVYTAAWPFAEIFVLAMLIIAIFPGLATWLPSLL